MRVGAGVGCVRCGRAWVCDCLLSSASECGGLSTSGGLGERGVRVQCGGVEVYGRVSTSGDV